MPKKDEEKMERQHVMLFAEDLNQLKALFGESIGVSKGIRMIIRQYLKKLSKKLEAENGKSS